MVVEDVQALTAASRVLLVGDTVGVPRVLRHLDRGLLCGIVGAEIRPSYHEPLARIATENRVEFLIQPRVTAPTYGGFVNSIRDLAPDLILCDSYSMLLRREVLQTPRFGAINVHAGLLPRYRGANPVQWMLINDETDAGVTIHYMDEGFDSGDVIATRAVDVMFTDTWREIMARIDTATNELLAAELPAIVAGTATATPQDPTQARRFPRRKPADGRIDWSQSVRQIYNLVRALVSPLPGAFYITGTEKVVMDDFMGIADVAMLKQRLTGWAVSEGARLRILPGASDQRMVLEVRGAGGQDEEAVLTALDYAGRRAEVRSTSGRVLGRIEEFARAELGITVLDSRTD